LFYYFDQSENSRSITWTSPKILDRLIDWRDVVQEDCQARKLNKEDAMDRWMEEDDKGCLMIRMGVSG